jgi:hypothetical protein
MKLVFLKASETPLVKSYRRLPDGTISKTAYPNAYAFTSFEESAPTLDDLAVLIKVHGDQGHCLLKGLLATPLNSESRAGSTDANQITAWGCFDLDGAGYASPDFFMQDMGFGDVSYVAQYSASHGIDPSSTGLRCHVFVHFDQPYHPALLKQFLQYKNLTLDVLRRDTRLTKTGCALIWPLDITTCQNDKLIYIAPPQLEGIADPLGPNRITVVKKAKASLALPEMIPSATAIRQMIDDRINELRKNANLPKRRASQYKVENTIEYMAKPDTAVVTGVKHERGFVYLNLNGGDSFAYWHHENNPEFIFNFKGEPVYKTEELVPDYYAQLRLQAKQQNSRILLAFRDFNSAQYWNGWYDQETDELEISVARSETQLRHFMKQHGTELGDFVPDWRIIFDPHDRTVVYLREQKLNVYRPSSFMKGEFTPTRKMPPVCSKIIHHVCGDDPLIVDHFNNWMACIFQYLDRTYTGWILHGTQGTGKGLLMNRILMPLFGAQNMTMKRMEELEQDFTGFFENVFLVVVDEIQTSASLKQAKITSKLKNLMVEPHISIRKMYREPYMARNYCNMIFTSNMPDPIVVAQDDRRFNVGNYQKKAINITEAEIAQIDGELHQMYSFWMTYPADRERAKRPLNTQGRQELIETNMQAAEVVARALRDGDLQFFYDQLPTAPMKTLPGGLIPNDPKQMITLKYQELMKEIVLTGHDKLTRDELMTIFRYCVGNCPETPNKFTSYLKHQQIHMTYVWSGAKSVRGIKVDWKSDPTWLAQAQKEVQ